MDRTNKGPNAVTKCTASIASQALTGIHLRGKQTFLDPKVPSVLSHAAVSMRNELKAGYSDSVGGQASSATTPAMRLSTAEKSTATPPLLEEILKLIPPCHTPARILVAEDNAMTRLCLSNLLDKWGVSFVLCKDGKEAWHELSHQAFDLALIDLQMPYMDGPKLVESLRQAPLNANSKIPIIALTGSSDPHVIHELYELGVSDCLIKPFEAGEFFRVMRQYTLLHAQQPIHIFSDFFDDQLLLQLYDNDYEHISYMFSLFLTNTPKSVATIQAAAEAQLWDDVQREVHKIKPTFAMVGLREISKLASRLEQKLCPNDLSAGLQIELERFCHKVEDALHAVASEQRLLTNYLK